MTYRDKLRQAMAVGARLRNWAATSGLAAPRPGEPPHAPSEIYDEVISDAGLREATRSLFVSHHYAQSVEQACKYLDNLVSTKSGIPGSGQSLMHAALNEKDPALKINRLQCQTDIDEQMGYRFLCAGCMAGVRNPRAHDCALADDAAAALEMLVLANHLVKKIRRARKSRTKAIP